MNGAGKTSILEAVFLAGFGKSFLSVRKAEMINHQSDQLILHLDVERSGGGKNTIHAGYQKKFSLLLDEKKSSVFEISRYLYPVIFSSSNYTLYIESKPYTRRLLDRFIFGIDAIYIKHLLSYNRALRQKNYLLKTKQQVDEISSWNKILSEMSEKIVHTKLNFIDRLNRETESAFHNRLKVRYSPSLDTGEGHRDISWHYFFDQLERRKQAEMMYKRSLSGPHLDDIEIHLDGRHLKYYSSGEKKINLLMLYISFIKLYKDTNNQYPVFLVDDFDTAIDKENIAFLMENCPEIQVIATSVNRSDGFDRLIELRKEN